MSLVEKRQIGSKKVMPFTIPSGIITTEPSCLERIAREIPQLGIVTTKSIGPEPRPGNREPILAQYIPHGFVNAVGLTNPGAEEFAKKLSAISFPPDKFLLVSIFGKDESEFVFVAKILEKYADGFELNFSCPHTKGYGMQLGQDKDIVGKITQAVAASVKRPIFVKLTSNAGNIGEIAKSAISSGAYGIAAINTVGPGYYLVDGLPVLTNKVGGVSGIGITPIGLKCVRDIRQAVGENVPIIGIGGISNAVDVGAYAAAGANFFGIGSALAGMEETEIKKYFSDLVGDINNNCRTNNAGGLLKQVDMHYKKVRIEEKIDSSCDFKIIKTNEMMNPEPGQFVFAWIPGVGEKPLSIMDDRPLTLGVLERGEFTKKLNSLEKGDCFYLRGPYGKKPNVNFNLDTVLVGGGCGIAGLTLIARRASKRLHNKLLRSELTQYPAKAGKFDSLSPSSRRIGGFSASRNKRLVILLGAKDKEHLPYLDIFKGYGEVLIATEDGSLGLKGKVIDLFAKAKLTQECYFFNCGPEKMIEAVLPLELNISRPQLIYSSLDYMTKCGVGLCGSCATKDGKRLCVDGPFMTNESR